MAEERYDLVIIGVGVAGLGAAYSAYSYTN